MKITDTIKYVGVNDHRIDLLEGQYKDPYNIWNRTMQPTLPTS